MPDKTANKIHQKAGSRRVSADACQYMPKHAGKYARDAEWKLANTKPEASAFHGLSQYQMKLLRQIGTVVGLLGLLTPSALMSAFMIAGYCVFGIILCFRIVLIAAGLFSRGSSSRHASGAEPSEYWPKYTILVPIYREKAALPLLIGALKSFDYPPRQLDIKLLIEADDLETIKALRSYELRPYFQVLVVPKGQIQTKPRALNYGLSFAKGEYVAIYDAEDQISATQLKAAVRAHRKAGIEGRKLACVQAPLLIHNGHESWIASQFSAEYAVQFKLLWKGLVALRLPVMLGGTSNHFHRPALDDVGGWDPHNVTEDADLGLRFAQKGYEIGYIEPPTFEEAPIRCVPWVKQRSRWIKGFIQTLIVFTRQPSSVQKRLGFKRHLSAHVLLGGSVVSAVCHGPFALWAAAILILPGHELPIIGSALFMAAIATHLISIVLVGQVRRLSDAFAALTIPFYWPLQSIAAFKALLELRRDPYFWDKTEHGKTAFKLNRKVLNKTG